MLPYIKTTFEKSEHKVYKRSNLVEILLDLKSRQLIPSSRNLPAFIIFLTKKTKLKIVTLSFPHRKETRYIWGNISEYELALSLRPGSYLSHQTAAHINGLTEKYPKNIYVNQEQPLKRTSPGDLTQDRIDVAFKNQPRISKMKAEYDNQTIWLISGMYTGQYGVVDVKGEKNEILRATNPERTLIDLSVRPAYAGGVYEVLNAYKLAKEKISIKYLSEMLRNLKYIYPYHQIVGFYLDMAGYSESDMFLEPEMKFDFYLAHHMSKTSYSKKWRLYYPKDFDKIS